MNNKKTLNGTQKFVFAPKKPVKKDLIPPQNCVPKSNSTNHSKAKVRPNVRPNLQTLEYNNTFRASANTYTTASIIECEDDEFINQNELMLDCKNEINQNFTENIALFNINSNEIYYNNKNEMFCIENEKVHKIECNEIDELRVVKVNDKMAEYGKVRKCYTMTRKV